MMQALTGIVLGGYGWTLHLCVCLPCSEGLRLRFHPKGGDMASSPNLGKMTYLSLQLQFVPRAERRRGAGPTQNE